MQYCQKVWSMETVITEAVLVSCHLSVASCLNFHNSVYKSFMQWLRINTYFLLVFSFFHFFLLNQRMQKSKLLGPHFNTPSWPWWGTHWCGKYSLPWKTAPHSRLPPGTAWWPWWSRWTAPRGPGCQTTPTIWPARKSFRESFFMLMYEFFSNNLSLIKQIYLHIYFKHYKHL